MKHKNQSAPARARNSSHRAASPADSPRVYLATMALLDHRTCLMIADQGGVEWRRVVGRPCPHCGRPGW